MTLRDQIKKILGDDFSIVLKSGGSPTEYQRALIDDLLSRPLVEEPQAVEPIDLHKASIEKIEKDLQLLPDYVAALKEHNNNRRAAVNALAGEGEISHIDKRISRLEGYFGCKIQDLPKGSYAILGTRTPGENGAVLFTEITHPETGKSFLATVRLPSIG